MFTIARDRTRNITLARFEGEFAPDVIGQLDHAGELLVEAMGPTHFLFDFTGIDCVSMPDATIAERGRRAPLCAGYQRVVVAPQPEIFGLYLVFAAKQRDVGSSAPIMVRSMKEALARLGVRRPAFEPLDMAAIERRVGRSLH